MKKHSQTNLPTISATDEKGVQWTLDSSAGKWTAVIEGKKISSKDFSTLREKVREKQFLTANPALAATAPAEQPKPIEVGLVMIKKGNAFLRRGEESSVSNTPISFVPVLAKIEWDAAKGEMAISKYKEKDTGWMTRDAGHILAVHPQLLGPEARKLISQVIEMDTISKAFGASEKSIANGWWDTKENKTVAWKNQHQHGLTQTTERHSHMTSRNLGYTSADWVIPDLGQDRDFSKWEAQEDGSLKLGNTVVRMQTTDGYRFDFQVFGLGSDQPLFIDTDLYLALTIGEATQFIQDQPSKTCQEWTGSADWLEEKKRINWPMRADVLGGAVFTEEGSSKMGSSKPVAYFLRSLPGVRGWGQDAYQEEEDKILKWAKNESYGAVAYRSCGPEDAALPLLAALNRDMVALTQQRGLHQPIDETLALISKDTIQAVSGEVENGEELANDIDTIAKQFSNVSSTLAARVIQQEDIANWVAHCDASSKEALRVIQSPSSAPSSKRRSP